MALQKRMLKGFAMGVVLAGILAVSGSFQEAKAQMYGQDWQPVQQAVVQGQQAYPPQQYMYGYATPKKYKRHVNTSGGYGYYSHGRYYGPNYGYGYGCSWW